MHAARRGHVPNAAAPQAYQCRGLIKQGLWWLVLERWHIGKGKRKVLTEAVAILPSREACHQPTTGRVSQCPLTETFTPGMAEDTSGSVHGLRG